MKRSRAFVAPRLTPLAWPGLAVIFRSFAFIGLVTCREIKHSGSWPEKVSKITSRCGAQDTKPEDRKTFPVLGSTLDLGSALHQGCISRRRSPHTTKAKPPRQEAPFQCHSGYHALSIMTGHLAWQATPPPLRVCCLSISLAQIILETSLVRWSSSTFYGPSAPELSP